MQQIVLYMSCVGEKAPIQCLQLQKILTPGCEKKKKRIKGKLGGLILDGKMLGNATVQ